MIHYQMQAHLTFGLKNHRKNFGSFPNMLKSVFAIVLLSSFVGCWKTPNDHKVQNGGVGELKVEIVDEMKNKEEIIDYDKAISEWETKLKTEPKDRDSELRLVYLLNEAGNQ